MDGEREMGEELQVKSRRNIREGCEKRRMKMRAKVSAIEYGRCETGVKEGGEGEPGDSLSDRCEGWMRKKHQMCK